jgi:hypothetical protein
MAYHLDSHVHDLNRLHNPWEIFTNRNERLHRAEDIARLCPPTPIPTPIPTPTTSSYAINSFTAHGNSRLDELVPRRYQRLRGFLNAAKSSSDQAVEIDVADGSSRSDIALLDDRRNHPECTNRYTNTCSGCKIFSLKLEIPQLLQRLKEEVSTAEILETTEAHSACTDLIVHCSERTISQRKG